MAQPSSSRVLALILILASATWLRLLFLGEKSFWLDEAFSVYVARLDWMNFWNVLTNSQANMAVYYGLLRFWLKLGESESVIRSLSVIWAVVTVPALYALGARLFGTRVGLISAALLALNGFHIRYAQEARSYSLVVFLVTLSSLFFLTSISRPSRKNWAGYILTSVMAVYSHFFATFVLAAQWASLVLVRPRGVPWKSLAASGAIMGLLLLPFVAFALTRDPGIDWIPRPRPANIASVFYALSGGTGRFALANEVGLLLLLAYFIVSIATVIVAVRTWLSRRASFETWHYTFLLAWLLVPVILAYVVSIVKPMFLAHYLIVCLPALVLIAGISLSRIRRHSVFVIAFAVIVALAVHEVFRYYRDVEKQNWRAATEFVLSQAQSGDAIIFDPWHWRRPFNYYRDRARGTSRDKPIVVLSDLQEPAPHYTRVWLIFPETHSLQASLAGSHSVAQKATFTDITILLYKRD